MDNKENNNIQGHGEEKKRSRRRHERRLQGGFKMGLTTYDTKAFKRNIMGFSELRANLSEVVESVIKDYKVVESGNVKKNSYNTASIISTQLLNEVLSQAYKFSPIVNYDETTSQYESILEEIGVYGFGSSEEEAIDTLLDMIIDVTDDYFENSDLYMRIPEQRAKFPYFLRIRQCESRKDLKNVLNL